MIQGDIDTRVAFYNPISSFDGTMSKEPRSFDEYGNVESFFPMSFLCNKSIFDGSEVAVIDDDIFSELPQIDIAFILENIRMAAIDEELNLECFNIQVKFEHLDCMISSLQEYYDDFLCKLEKTEERMNKIPYPYPKNEIKEDFFDSFEKVLINNEISMKTVLLNIESICDTQDLYNYIYESKQNYTRRQR